MNSTCSTPEDHCCHEESSESSLTKLVVALLCAAGSELLTGIYTGPYFKYAGIAIALTAIVLSGFSIVQRGLQSLMYGKLDVGALMSVAVIGAFLIGQWAEAAMVMALYNIAELIEARTADRARDAIKGLMAISPETAEVLMPDGQCKLVAVGEVVTGSTIRIKPGERIALDGVISKGASVINQMPVTGESVPVDKTINDPVFAGTINETASIEVLTTALASNSTLSRIIHVVEQAQEVKAPTQRFVDRFASIYTPAVFFMAAAVAVLSPWLMGISISQGVYKALVLLVIACPCALVIATPVTVVSGLASAARRGILIKGGIHLEEARKLRVIAFDKTGTITEGKLVLVDTEILDQSISADQIKKWAWSLAASSDHPVSVAIKMGLENQNHFSPSVDEFHALPGRGVQGSIDGKIVILGNHRLIEEKKLCSPDIENKLFSHESKGRTVSLLASENKVLAIFAVADQIKPSSRQVSDELQKAGILPVILTGDNAVTGRVIATQAGIEMVKANLLPEDKLNAIGEFQKSHGHVAMIGDGINDAPALARADLGIAMGAAGTDTAMETADVVIMNDDLKSIPVLIRLSKYTHSVLWQNISIALAIKSIFLLLAIFGGATMWMAVFADMGASLLVVFNGLRIIRE